MTFPWAATWWRHYGRGRPWLAVLEDPVTGIARGILPLVPGRLGPLRTLRLLGHGPGDRLGVAGDPGDRGLLASGLVALLDDDTRHWDVLLAERLPGDALPAVPRARVLRETASPVIDLGASWEDVAAGFGRKLRKELARKARVLEREHAIVFRRADDPERIDRDFDTFLALHRARWPDGRSSLLPRADFHRAFARAALERGWLQLWLLEVDGRAVAARYDFALGGAWYAYNAGRDPAWNRYSVGLLLRAHTMREAIGLGARTYHLLRGDEAYKDRLATRDPGLLTLGVGRGPLGRLAVHAGHGLLATRGTRRIVRRAVTV